MTDDRTLDQLLMDVAKRRAKRRMLYWLLGGGLPVIGGGFLVLVFALGSIALLAGVGQWLTNFFGPSPPAIATTMSRPGEWLVTVTADAAPWGVPNVVALAVLNQASDGQVYGDRYYCSNQESAGEACSTAYHPGLLGIGPHHVTTLGIGYGLFGLGSQSGLIPQGQDVHSATWNLATGIAALAHHLSTGGWQAGLTAFHQAVQAPASWIGDPHYASQIQGLIQSYDAGPTLGAWALAPWSDKTGQFTDPGHQPAWVFVVGTAPTGATEKHAWTTPTVIRSVNPKTGQVTRITHANELNYQDLGEPIQVWGTTQSGRHVAFELSSVSGSNIPVWSGGVVWGARVPLTGKNKLVMIHAQWANGVRDTIHWPEQASGAVGYVQVISNQQALNQWWPDIQMAAHQTGTAANLIASVMLHESGGNPALYAMGNTHRAFGLMQIEPHTAAGLPGYNPSTWHNPQDNLLLGGELLQADYQQTGGTSWREAIADYYGGLGNMEAAGFHVGMPWSAAQSVLNVIPDPNAGNTETMTQYADQMMAEEQWVVMHAPKS